MCAISDFDFGLPESAMMNREPTAPLAARVHADDWFLRALAGYPLQPCHYRAEREARPSGPR
jgi:hypothetical protein